MSDVGRPSRDDEVYVSAVISVLRPYIEAARVWWNNFENRSFYGTTTYPINDAPPGMYEKCTRSPRQSPIYGIQAFPIVSMSYLTYPIEMRGGPIHLTDHICKRGLIIDEFTVISKLGINSSHMNGRFLCIVPTKMLGGPKARWIYMRPSEIVELASGIVTTSLIERILPFAKEYRRDI